MNFKRGREIETERWKEEKKGKERKKTIMLMSQSEKISVITNIIQKRIININNANKIIFL